ncbi:hypothetical protein V7968_32120 [Nocardia vulneris]|uniref:hypothetical protein n=1 Tax=Nocardia vulneris TaxID=1141657 RepID=UPI0030D5E0A2
MVVDAFERLDHGNRDVGADTHCSHPTGSVSVVDAVSARRVGVVVFVVIAALCSLIAGAISANHDDDRDRRLQYQECVTQERVRIAREGSLLQPEDFCDLDPGR